MDWERVLINLGMVTGFLALIAFWVGLALWLRIDADKRGLPGWAWIFIGIAGGPLALFVYLVIRGNRPVLPVVLERDALLEEAARTGIPSDFNPREGAQLAPEVGFEETGSGLKAALEAEERSLRNF